MVAHVLRLRFALLLGSLRGTRVARTVIGLVLVVAATIVSCLAVLSLADADAVVAHSVLVLGAAAIFLAFLVGPVIVGATDQLDPRRFGVFGVDERRMPAVLAVASVVSIPTLALAALTVCGTVVVIRLGSPWPIAVVTGVVSLLCTVVAARVGMALNALLLPERRSRELTAVFALVVVVVAFPVAIFFASLGWQGEGAVPAAVAVATGIAGVTPFAAGPALALAIAAGDTAGAWVSGIVAVLTVAAVWLLWSWLVRRLLTTTERPIAARERQGLGWFALLPSTPFGAIAARSLVYWLRDRRYIVNIIVVPIAGVLTVFPLLVAGMPLWIAALVPVPVMALFFGWLPHNDIAYDSTAFWTHVASGVRGLPDRLGRLVPIALVAIPLLAIAIPVTFAIIGDWGLLLPLTGVTAALFLGGLGVSSAMSVLAPYAVSRPGDSPFQQPQRSASRGSYGQAWAFLGTLLVSAPTLWLFGLTIAEGDQYAPAAFWVGAGTGALVLIIGTVLGGFIFDRSGQRLMEFVETA